MQKFVGLHDFTASTLTLPVVDTRNTDNASNRIAIIDIDQTCTNGCYDAPARLLVPIFNERVVCGLGKGIGKSGKNEGVERPLCFGQVLRPGARDEGGSISDGSDGRRA